MTPQTYMTDNKSKIL